MSKVLFLTGIFCTRALKCYLNLKDNKIDVVVGYEYPSKLLNYVDKKTKFNNTPIFVSSLINKVQPTLIHVHNTPNTPALYARKAFKGKIIFDIHDYLTSADGWNPNEVRAQNTAIDVSDYIITVSDKYAGYIKSVSRTPKNITTVPSIYFFDKTELPKLSKDGLNHICVIGSMYSMDYAKKWNEILCEVAIKNKIHIHLHINYNRNIIKKRNEYFHVENEIEFNKIPTELSKYDAGIVLPGGAVGTLPNKFFDYINAGIPIISDPSRDVVSELIGKYNLGAVINIKDITNNTLNTIKSINTFKFIEYYKYNKYVDVSPYKELVCA